MSWTELNKRLDKYGFKRIYIYSTLRLISSQTHQQQQQQKNEYFILSIRINKTFFSSKKNKNKKLGPNAVPPPLNPITLFTTNIHLYRIIIIN